MALLPAQKLLIANNFVCTITSHSLLIILDFSQLKSLVLVAAFEVLGRGQKWEVRSEFRGSPHESRLTH